MSRITSTKAYAALHATARKRGVGWSRPVSQPKGTRKRAAFPSYTEAMQIDSFIDAVGMLVRAIVGIECLGDTYRAQYRDELFKELESAEERMRALLAEALNK